jgi:hypothetical protein
LLVVVLLISAASLASYLLSQWTPLRSSGRTLAWAGLSIGTVLLLAAAVVVALSMRSLSTLHLSENGGLPQQMIKPVPQSSVGNPDDSYSERAPAPAADGNLSVRPATAEALQASMDLCYATQDYAGAILAAREYLREYPGNQERVQLLLIKALSLNHEYAAAGRAADYLIAPRELAGEEIPAELEKLRASAAAQVEFEDSQALRKAQNRTAPLDALQVASAPAALPNEIQDHPVAQIAALDFEQGGYLPTPAIPDGGNALGAELWLATSCVRAVHADAADANRWSIENECTSPIAVVFATCTESSTRCDDTQSSAWKYQLDGMVLPGKARSATAAEAPEQFGRQIRYVACAVTAAIPVKLLSLEAAMRSSSTGRLQLEAARNEDECLVRVQRWSDAGSRSAMSIDAFLREGLPRQ